MPKFSEMLFGSPEKIEQIPLYNKEQTDLMNRIRQGIEPGIMSGMGYLNQMLSGEPGALDAFTKPYMRQFQEQTIPGLSERFANLDAQKSSAFGQSLGQAGAGLQEQLAALRENIRMQSLSQLQPFMQYGLMQQNQPRIKEATSGMFSGMMGGMAPALGQFAGQGLGALGGALFGGGGAAGGAAAGGGAGGIASALTALLAFL